MCRAISNATFILSTSMAMPLALLSTIRPPLSSVSTTAVGGTSLCRFRRTLSVPSRCLCCNGCRTTSALRYLLQNGCSRRGSHQPSRHQGLFGYCRTPFQKSTALALAYPPRRNGKQLSTSGSFSAGAGPHRHETKTVPSAAHGRTLRVLDRTLAGGVYPLLGTNLRRYIRRHVEPPNVPAAAGDTTARPAGLSADSRSTARRHLLSAALAGSKRHCAPLRCLPCFFSSPPASPLLPRARRHRNTSLEATKREINPQ